MGEDGERANERESDDDAAASAENHASGDAEAEAGDPGGTDDADAGAADPDDGGSVSASEADGDADRPTSADIRDEAAARPEDAPRSESRRASKLWWALPILMVVEFYAYGHNGRLEVCVGKDGDTDFSLVGQQRTDENRWKFPRCETRLDLGLRSQRETKVEEATKVACRGATIFRHQGEAKDCVAAENGWQHRVDGHFVPPWDPAYYRHLFWFLQ